MCQVSGTPVDADGIPVASSFGSQGPQTHTARSLVQTSALAWHLPPLATVTLAQARPPPRPGPGLAKKQTPLVSPGLVPARHSRPRPEPQVVPPGDWSAYGRTVARRLLVVNVAFDC